MATYASYRKLTTDNFNDNIVLDTHLTACTRKQYTTLWVYGSPDTCSPGCCCLWTVPAYVRKVTFDLWGAGGNGHGSCSNNICQHFMGAMGGAYNAKTIDTVPGCQYTICAAGVYRCWQIDCCGCKGCSSYVLGFNLSNFCADGGYGGRTTADWTTTCNSTWYCCLGPGQNGGDFGFTQHTDRFGAAEYNYGAGWCHCYIQSTQSSSAPLIGTAAYQGINVCWIRCGCWPVPYGNGGQGAMNTYCGTDCCGSGGTGGPGLVKITYF